MLLRHGLKVRGLEFRLFYPKPRSAESAATTKHAENRITFILTDRKSLDTNIREDIANFTHLKDVVGIAKHSDDLPRFLNNRQPFHYTVRRTLYMATLVATRFNPTIKTVYERLLAQGKLKKVALTAAMKELITILNAMVRTATTGYPSCGCVPTVLNANRAALRFASRGHSAQSPLPIQHTIEH